MQTLMIFRLTLGRILIVALLIGSVAGCSEPEAAGLAGNPQSIGDPAQGQALIEKLGCGSCHDIPGVIGAHGMVGPPLTRMASRQYVAGLLRNTPENMVRWLRFPQKVVPGNAMPNLGLSDRDARQIAAYLATLK
jgi:cytochrome c2